MLQPNKKAGGSQMLRTQEDVVAENKKKTFNLPAVNSVWLVGREGGRERGRLFVVVQASVCAFGQVFLYVGCV